jgi:hypothetical protein
MLFYLYLNVKIQSLEHWSVKKYTDSLHLYSLNSDSLFLDVFLLAFPEQPLKLGEINVSRRVARPRMGNKTLVTKDFSSYKVTFMIFIK